MHKVDGASLPQPRQDESRPRYPPLSWPLSVLRRQLEAILCYHENWSLTTRNTRILPYQLDSGALWTLATERVRHERAERFGPRARRVLITAAERLLPVCRRHPLDLHRTAGDGRPSPPAMVPPGRNPYTGGLSAPFRQRLDSSPENPPGSHRSGLAGNSDSISKPYASTQLALVESTGKPGNPPYGIHRPPPPRQEATCAQVNQNALIPGTKMV